MGENAKADRKYGRSNHQSVREIGRKQLPIGRIVYWLQAESYLLRLLWPVLETVTGNSCDRLKERDRAYRDGLSCSGGEPLKQIKRREEISFGGFR